MPDAQELYLGRRPALSEADGELLERHVCLKVFENNAIVQATYLNRKTTPGITFGGSNEYFLNANQYAIDHGRNFTGADIDLLRPVAIIGTDIVKKLFSI